MKKYLLATTATGAAMALTAPAQADNYIKIFGGVNFIDDQNVVLASSSLAGTYSGTYTGTFNYFLSSHTHSQGTSNIGNHYWYVNASSVYKYGSYFYSTLATAAIGVDTGFVIGAAAGRTLGNGFEIELEVAYRKNNIDVAAAYNAFFSAYFTFSAYGTLTTRFHVSTGSYTFGGGTYYTSSSISGFSITGFSTTAAGTFSTSTSTTAAASLSGDLTSWSIMANLWYDFGHGKQLHPYIGGGIGYADVTLEAGGIDISDSNFAWQFGAGLGYDITSNTRINFEFRYFEVPDLALEFFGRDIEFEYQVTEVLVGLRHSF